MALLMDTNNSFTNVLGSGYNPLKSNATFALPGWTHFFPSSYTKTLPENKKKTETETENDEYLEMLT